jgi:hypothetical protein
MFWEILDINERSPAQKDCPFDAIFQLTDIAGPWISPGGAHRLVTDSVISF